MFLSQSFFDLHRLDFEKQLENPLVHISWLARSCVVRAASLLWLVDQGFGGLSSTKLVGPGGLITKHDMHYTDILGPTARIWLYNIQRWQKRPRRYWGNTIWTISTRKEKHHLFWIYKGSSNRYAIKNSLGQLRFVHHIYLHPLWCCIKVTTRIRSKKEFLELLERIPRFRTKETQMQEVSKFKLKQGLTWLGSNKYRTNSSPNKTGKPEKSAHPKFKPRQNPNWPKSPQGETQFRDWRGGKQNLAQKDWGVYFTWT